VSKVEDGCVTLLPAKRSLELRWRRARAKEIRDTVILTRGLDPKLARQRYKRLKSIASSEGKEIET
jgi:hypothetical protein